MKRLFWALGLSCLALAGCFHWPGSLQKDEERDREKDLAIRTVGDVTEIANVGPWQVSGVGLVRGLNGTGDCPKCGFRTELEQQLLKQKAEHVQAILDDPNNALVLVTAFISPGAHKGDPLDIVVTLPEGSKCSSLEGGYLEETVLRNHDSTRRLSPEYAGGNRMIAGHVLVRAKGKLQVGFGGPAEPGGQRTGRIWEGGVTLVDRPFYVTLKNDEKSARIAADVAARINFMFQDDAKKRDAVLRNRHLFLLDDVTKNINGEKRTDMAKAVSKEMIHVRVPFAYRYSPERYLRVLRLMPLREDPEKSAAYRKRLGDMLTNPNDAVRAALRLEALGSESVAALKKGLTSPHPIVRFACAESLVYLDNMAGVEELAKLAEEYPLLCMNGILALAGSEESLCKQKLAALLSSPITEVRCGAFWAMRLNRDHEEEAPEHRHPSLRTEPVGKALWLHRPAPAAKQLIYIVVQGRGEIALFGEEVRLQAPIRLLAGSNFSVVVDAGDEVCTISRVASAASVRREQCGLALEDVLKTMVQMGASYPEIVDLMMKLRDRGGLPCPVARSDMALPEAAPLERLITEGKELGKERAAAK
jgi:flagellar basal body P-ring protein FlgI